MLGPLSTELGILHDMILRREKYLLSLGDRAHLVFAVKVPTDYHLVEELLMNMFHLRFDKIFNMFHLFRLNASLLRLWALHQAYAFSIDNVQDIALEHPYYMHQNNLHNREGRETTKKYITEFMLPNKDKESLLMPYYYL
jgi:hypothetical protein